MASNSSLRTKGQQTLTEGLVAVPASATDIVAHDAVIFQIVVSNPTGSGITFNVLDKNTSPLQLLNITVAANSSNIIPYSEGVKMIGGIRWQAGGTGLVAEVFGFNRS